MNKKFLSAILFGALMVTSTGTFVSCKDYDDDIDRIDNALNDIKSKLSDLETKVNAGGVYVSKIESVDGGFKVTTSDGQSYNLTLPNVGAGSTVTIDPKTGAISIDGEATGFFATTGVETAPYVKDGYWYLYDAKTKAFVKSEYKAAGNAYAVIKGDVVTLNMPDENGVMKSIVLPLTANTLTAITLPNALTIGNEVASGTLANGKEISSAKAEKLDWKGPKGAIAKDQFLVGQIGAANLVVSPMTYDLSAQELTLVDSKGNVAPVKVIATPNDFNGLITGSRAASENGNWNLTVEMTDEVTADNIAKVFVSGGENILYALCVNGIPYTTYDIAIKTKAPETTVNELSFDEGSLSYVDAEGKKIVGDAGAINLPTGTTTLKYADANLYDSYITFEGIHKSEAVTMGVKAEGMTITAPESASGKTIVATVKMVNISGVETKSSNTVTLKFAGATVEAPTEIAATEYKVMPNTTIAEVLPVITIDLGDALSKLDAKTISAIKAEGQLSVIESADQKGFIVASTSNAFTATYHKANAQGKVGDAWAAGTDGLDELRFIKIAVDATARASNNVAEDAKPGEYKLTLSIKDGTTANSNEIAKIDMPVNVTVPTFDELFETTDAWVDGVYKTRIYAGGTGDVLPLISFANAYNEKADAEFGKINYTFDKIDNEAVATAASGIATLVKAVVYNTDGNALAHDALNVTASYSILNNLEAYAGNKTANLSDLQDEFVVKSSKFVVKIQTIFDGGKLVYYKDGSTLDLVTCDGDGIINSYALVDKKKQGLALNFQGADLPVNGADANIPADKYGTASLKGLTFGTGTLSDNKKGIAVTYATTLNGVTVAYEAASNNLQLEEANGNEFKTSLVVTLTDATGIVYTQKIKVQSAQ